MASILILRMPPAGPQDTEWLLVDEGGARVGPRQRGPLELAAAVAQQRRVIVIVPGTEVLLAEPELPPGGETKIARAVPFALEEQLTDDIDSLHFAIGRRSSGASTPVAVVSRTVLASWLSRLKTAGIAANALYADLALMPDNPSKTVLWLEGARLSVRRHAQPPFTVEIEPIDEALAVAGVIGPQPPDADEGSASAQHVLLFATQEDWNGVHERFDALIERFESLQVQILPEGPLEWLAREMAAANPINLLQGEFQPTQNAGTQWRRWRMAAFLACGLLGAHIAAESTALHHAKQQISRLDAEIARIAAQTLPGENPADARRKMQARLAQIRGGGAGPEYFLRSLQTLSAAIARQPNTSIDALSYRDRTLDLKITAPRLDDLAQLSRAVAKQGLSADIQSSVPAGNAVEGRLQIRSQAPAERR